MTRGDLIHMTGDQMKIITRKKDALILRKEVIKISKGKLASEKEANFLFINESDGVLGNFLKFYKATINLSSRLILLKETGSRTA
jgi:hypothetical protein